MMKLYLSPFLPCLLSLGNSLVVVIKGALYTIKIIHQVRGRQNLFS